jgi:hypothetical protein
MNWRKISLYSGATMLLLLLGCRPDPICVKAIDTRANHFTLSFTEPEGRRSCISDARIISITFRRQADDQVLWVVGPKRQTTELSTSTERDPRRREDPRKLSTITYGIVPEGFHAPGPADTPPPLKSGETIEISVNGITSSGYLKLTLD